MSAQVRVVRPGKKMGEVIGEEGQVLFVPAGWELLPPGDAALTRRVKKAGACWQVQEKKGRRLFSRGVWAPGATIRAVREGLAAERLCPAYQKKRAADRVRRDKQQSAYVEDFRGAVMGFLHFHPRHGHLAEALARAVTEQASPVGSGTVARTRRIPLKERAEAAVIAWMRHHTTPYDTLKIPRIKGERRRVRRTLAKESVALLERYRRGDEVKGACPLEQALCGSGTGR